MEGPGLDLVLLTPRDMIAPYAIEKATTIARRATVVSFPLPLSHLNHTCPQPLCVRDSPRDVETHAPHAVIPNSLPTAADTKSLSAVSNGEKEPMGQARMGGSQKGKHTLPGAGWGLPPPYPIALYLCILTCQLADALRADDQVHSDVPSLLESKETQAVASALPAGISEA